MWLWRWLRALLNLDLVERESRSKQALAALSNIERAVLHPPLEPPPREWATILVVGKRDGMMRTMGAQHEVIGPREDWTLNTHLPIDEVNVIVFCDLRRVRVTGIYFGVDLASVGLGPCPIVFFPRWEPGQLLRIQAERLPY